MSFDDLLVTLRITLQVATTSALVSLVPGIALGWLLTRRTFTGRSLLEAVVTLPMVLPPVAVGLLLLNLFSRHGPLGALHLLFTWPAAAAASAVMSFPLMVRSVQLAVVAVPTSLENVAATLGAPPAQVFFSITLPLSRRGIVTGVLLTFARSVGEFGATILVAGNSLGTTRTLSTGIYSAILDNRDGDAWLLAGLAAALALAATWVGNQWLSPDRTALDQTPLSWYAAAAMERKDTGLW